MRRSAHALKWAGMLSVAVLLVCSVPTSAQQDDEKIQWVPGQRMQKAVGRVIKTANVVNDKSAFGYDNEVCILAAFLPSGESASFNRNLVQGREYLILGGGDDNMEDMDLEVKDENGTKVAEDTLTDASPVVRFTARSTGRFTIKATAFKADRGSFACVVIMRKDGWDVPIRNLQDAMTSLMKRCDRIDRGTKDKVYFHDVKNQWALYGSVLKEGEDMSIINLDVGTGRRAVLAGGDSFARDVDLFVRDRDDKVVAKDEDDDAVPVVSLTATRYQGAKITYKNVRSQGASLTLMTMLRFEKP